jgi:hypothetical protein
MIVTHTQQVARRVAAAAAAEATAAPAAPHDFGFSEYSGPSTLVNIVDEIHKDNLQDAAEA